MFTACVGTTERFYDRFSGSLAVARTSHVQIDVRLWPASLALKLPGLARFHQFHKSSEVMLSIVGTGSGFGMVLH